MLLAEACVMQVLNKRFSPTEGFDTPIEIRVSRLVMTHHSADEREDAGKIEIIHSPHKATRGIGELKNRHLSTGF